MKHTRLTTLLGVMLLIAACKDPGLSVASDQIRFAPKPFVDFGNVYVDGSTHTQTFSLINDGRATIRNLEWRGLSAPFEAKLPIDLPPGEMNIAVNFTPEAPGKASQLISLKDVTQLLTITGTGVAIPACTPSGPCMSARFDTKLGQCVEASLVDGTTCDAQSACITDGQCQSGRCIGKERNCNDGNACTVDVCNAETGCEFLPRPPCPGDGECLVGVCDPAAGCTTVPADDGITCGSLQTCKSAQVCVTGACVVRNPPENYLCAEASPCQGEGRCVNDQCVRKSLEAPLVDTWSFDGMASPLADGGIEEKQLHDFVLEPTGAMTLSGFFQSPARLRANTPAALDAPEGPSRRCIMWNGRLVCADYPSAPNGRVTAIDITTGLTLWSFDVHKARPDFVAVTTQIFLARLVVQASDRLAAIFEAYPNSVPSGPLNGQCRAYFLVVINAKGELITASPLVDPLLTACNHPHPYGAVSDAVGNLFLAFSPTVSAQAPLKPGKPTLLLSYTRDGIFRWKVTDPSMEGGELAVARGLLYPENGDVVRTAATGAEAFGVPQKLGRIVVADSRFIPAPVAGQMSLMGYEAGQPNLSWSHDLPPSMRFWSDQLRLASWRSSRGSETVALAFVQDQGTLQASLRAIRVHDGSEAFTCPVNVTMRTAPQLFEIANGSMGLMEGALDQSGQPGCNKCDPPFANSAAAFHSIRLQGISVPKAPWVGTFGGAGHDHREEVDPSTPGNASN